MLKKHKLEIPTFVLIACIKYENNAGLERGLLTVE